MRYYTDITAYINVEMGAINEDSQLLKYVNQYLKNAPKITGDENNADVSTNLQKNYGMFEDKSQKQISISVNGKLLNRIKSQTLNEFNDFLDYIGGLGHIRDYSLNIKNNVNY